VSLVHLAVVIALLIGCAGPAKGTRLPPGETATPAPTPTLLPTATSLPTATVTPLPTATPTIAPTASLPTATPSSSPSSYSEWVRTSQYVTVRDGTRLAVDIFRPTLAGKPVQDPLPVIWTYERFQRAAMVQGRPFTELDRFPYLITLLQHGYVVAAADARGSGASFGTSPGLFNPQEILDTFDLTEWFAAQPWCNKAVGMFGKNYAGSMQYLAASAAPPHLKAIMPEMAPADVYWLIYPGGVIHDALISALSFNIKSQDRRMPALPVDEDRDGSLRDAAIQQHALNADVAQIAWQFPYRNSADKESGNSPYLSGDSLGMMKQISQSKVPIYHIAGWFDLFTRDGFLMFNGLDNPQKLLASSWEWEAENSFDFTNERLRW